MDSRSALATCALALVTLVGFACGGDDDGGARPTTPTGTPAQVASTTASSSGAQTPASNTGTDAGVESVTGDVQLGGALTGTFSWNKDLAVDWCSPERVDFTLTDGKDTYIAISSVKLNDGTDESSVSSAKLNGGPFSSKSVPIDARTATNGSTTGSVTWSNVQMRSPGGEMVTVDGTLTFNCP